MRLVACSESHVNTKYVSVNEWILCMGNMTCCKNPEGHSTNRPHKGEFRLLKLRVKDKSAKSSLKAAKYKI